MFEALRHALHRRQRPARYTHLAEMLANQRLSRAQVLAKQRADLAAIVDFARVHVPFYRDRFAGFSPSRMSSNTSTPCSPTPPTAGRR